MPGATIRNIVVEHPIVTAQLLTGSEAQHAENPLQIGRRAPEIRFRDRAEIFRVIEPVRVRGVAVDWAKAAQVAERRDRQAVLAQAELTRLVAGISRGMLPVAGQHSDAATTTAPPRGPAAPGAAAVSAAAGGVAGEVEAVAGEGRRWRRKDRTQNETSTNSICQTRS